MVQFYQVQTPPSRGSLQATKIKQLLIPLLSDHNRKNIFNSRSVPQEQCLKLNSFGFTEAQYIVLTFFILPLTAYNLILNWPVSKAWYLGRTGVMQRPYLWSQRDLTLMWLLYLTLSDPEHGLQLSWGRGCKFSLVHRDKQRSSGFLLTFDSFFSFFCLSQETTSWPWSYFLII